MVVKKAITTIVLFLFLIGISFEVSSFISTKKYIATNDTELPKLYFEGDIKSLKTKKEENKISVTYESNDLNFKGYAKIKLQGSSSLNYSKKNYTIKFYKDKDLDKKLEIDFGWGKQNKYCLKANWIDKTHSRNIVTANIVSDIQKKYNLLNDTPNYGEIDGTPIEIYSNGDFLGLYTLNIPKDAWMFGMDEDNENHVVVAADFWNDQTLFKEDDVTFEDYGIEAGPETDETLEKINRVHSFVVNSTDEEFRKSIDEYFNLDSLLNYYIMLEFAELVDNVAKNMLLVTYDGKIWYTTLYDLDSSWGTTTDGRNTLGYEIVVGSTGSELWAKLRRVFPNELADRYFELRKEFLNEEYIMNKFSTFKNSISEEALKKERDRWSNIPGYDISQIEDFLAERIPMVDKMFTELYTKDNTVTVVYTKNSDGTITAKLTNLRGDIIVSDSDSYTFENDGEHSFLYSDFLGNKMYITASASGVRYNFNN